MSRIFSLLALISVCLILSSGAGVYWLSRSDSEQLRQNAGAMLAERLRQQVSGQLMQLQHSLDTMAQYDEVKAALRRGAHNDIASTAAKLEGLLPQIMKLRLLPINISEPDRSAQPHLGYADLEMAKAALTAEQMPGFQGEGQNRHLALTSRVGDDEHTLGVLLASFNPDFLKATLNPAAIDDGWYEIKQQQTLLLGIGDRVDKIGEGSTLNIPHSAWSLNYWPSQQSGSPDPVLLVSTMALCGLLSGLCFFIAYRRLTQTLQQDQGSVFKLVKDLLNGKMTGNYPAQLPEMKAMIANLVQYKRVLEKQKHDRNDPASEFGEVISDANPEDNFFDTVDTDDETTPEAEEPKQDLLEPLPDEELSLATSTAPTENDRPQADIANLFKRYDIRGIVDQNLTPDIVFKIGQALGSEAKDLNIKTLVVGRDGRLSSRALATALMQGLNAVGVDVLDIGLIPTPVLYFVAHHLEGRSGAIITGSHNPADYNGVKIVLKGETLSGDRIQRLRQRIETGDFAPGGDGSTEQNTQFTNEYIGIISEDIHIARPMKIVLDCGNGAAGELAPVLLKTLGCEVIELYCEVDGHFPNHHPDPSKPENLSDLITAVKHYQADVGIALDGDGDRLGIVDNDGNIIWPDRQLMLFAKDVLSSKPGSEIIFDVKCTRHLGEQIGKLGGRPLMWKTGHSLLKAKLKESGAALAGEMSGHVIFNDRWFGFDDGLYAASRMIEILSIDTRSSSEVFAALPDSVNTPELSAAIAEGEGERIVEQLFDNADFPDGNIVDIDGLRVDFADGWGLVRASNTTPSLVMRFEADNSQALSRIQQQFKQLLLKVKPDLSLPF